MSVSGAVQCDRLPEGGLLRVALERRVGEQAVGEDDVLGGEGAPVCQVTSGPQVEGHGQAVVADLPALGEVGQRRAIVVQAGEAGEDERGEVAVGVAGVDEQRVHAGRGADDRLRCSRRACSSSSMPPSGLVKAKTASAEDDDADAEHGEERPTRAVAGRAATVKRSELMRLWYEGGAASGRRRRARRSPSRAR